MNSQSQKRIHVIFESSDGLTPHGSSYIRLIRPLTHPTIAIKYDISFSNKLPKHSVDLVIIERQIRPSMSISELDQMISLLTNSRTPYIYAIDDNLLCNKNSFNGHTGENNENRLFIIRRLISAAAGVIVSTKPLALRLGKMNQTIRIVPNYLDERLFPGNFPVKDDHIKTLRFGYMGTPTHLGDLMMIAPAIRKILHRYSEFVELELVGIADSRLIAEIFDGFNVSCLQVPTADIEYPKFCKWISSNLHWDFAVAPLVDCEFNDSKSDLKYLDYGVCGIPGIFSNTPSYASTINSGANGILSRNTIEDWFISMESILLDNNMRRLMSRNAFEDTWSNRMLDKNVWCLMDAIEDILQQVNSSNDEMEYPTQSRIPSTAMPRLGKPLTREEKVLIHIDTMGAGLEVGPSYNPILPKAKGYNIKTVDHAPAEVLRAKYASVTHGVDINRIEHVDYVWKGEPLDALIQKPNHFDYIIASHVIEHTPDMISFLKQLENLLREGGIVSLVIPDRRYCFDTFRPCSTIGDILQAHIEMRTRHTPGTVFDHFYSIVSMNSLPSWKSGDHGTFEAMHSAEEAWKLFDTARDSEEYIDVHNWRFTPSSFVHIICALAEMNYLGLEIASFYATEGCEFFVSLRKSPLKFTFDRLKLLESASNEN